MIPLRKPRGIIIHHSATRDTDSISYRAIRRFHKGLGWDDIGYHFLIESVLGQPVLFTGRAVQYHGAHCVGKNDCLGVCVVGNYDDPSGPVMADGKIDLLANLLAGQLIIYPHLSVNDIDYHRSYAEKTCPGTKFPELEQIRDLVRSKLSLAAV